MSGIVFFRTRMLPQLREFYCNELGCLVWQEQPDCVIFRHGNLLFGLCDRDEPYPDKQGLITFFYETRQEVDGMYGRLKPIAEGAPSFNDKYRIYQFFARDPEGRRLEFQWFEDHVDRYRGGDELLTTRRSVRQFSERDVPDAVVRRVIELSRFAPSAYNHQPCYFRPVRDRETIAGLAAVREDASAPIGRAPLAVGICADPEISERFVVDGCLAAFQFLLAAWSFGLGTCWMGDMDRPEVKRLLDIPGQHHVVTVTPLGYPAALGVAEAERKDLSWFLRE